MVRSKRHISEAHRAFGDSQACSLGSSQTKKKSPAYSSKGDTGGKDIKDDYEKDIEDRRDRKKSIQQRLGIQLTLAGILKQSSIFTGVLGSLFQILGAFADTFLMAFFPLPTLLVSVVDSSFDEVTKTFVIVGVL